MIHIGSPIGGRHSRRAGLFALVLGSAVFCATTAITAAWDSADARGGRGHASVGRASGGFFGGRSGASRASIRPMRASVRNAGARRAARNPGRQLVRAQKRYKAEREQFSRNRYNQLSALHDLKGRYVDQRKAYGRATKSLLGTSRKYGNGSLRYRFAERRWQRQGWKLAAAKQSYGDQRTRARNVYRQDRRQYKAAERRLGRATDNYFRSQPGNNAGPRELTDGVTRELRPIRR